MIQWYPGHMAKAIREIEEKVKIVDMVIVLLDARVPYSSFNPSLKKVLNNKKTLYLMTKADKADDKLTAYWTKYYSSNDSMVIAIDARNNKSKKIVENACELLMKEKREKDKARGLKPRPIRSMICGVPNVGKSTLINTLCGKKVAQVGDKPGVTKAQQWTRINPMLELLDTPGVLWPKFEDENVGFNLAITGAIKSDILPNDEIAYYFINFLTNNYPGRINFRYNVEETGSCNEVLERIGNKLHYMIGDEVDIEKTALYFLQEYRNDYLGKVTLDQRHEEKTL